MDEDALLKLRYEYAWNHFAYHAQQRTTMFNYFLVVMGILINGYVGLVEAQLPGLASALGFVAAAIAVGFVLLDLRNQQLVYLGEDVLRTLEVDAIFADFESHGSPAVPLSLMQRDLAQSTWPRKLVSHSRLMPLIELTLVAVCLAAAILPLTEPELFQSPVPSASPGPGSAPG